MSIILMYIPECFGLTEVFEIGVVLQLININYIISCLAVNTRVI